MFLMHPKEYKREKASTGRLTHLCLARSRILTGVGFDEDPATGSAAAAFAGVAMAFERPEEGEHEIRIEQGDAMGRPSRITLFMSIENNELADVAIGGLVCSWGEGVLRL